MGHKESIRHIDACILLYEFLEKLTDYQPICSASFNVILEGLFRNHIDSKNNNSFSDEFINYRQRYFYITKIKIDNEGHFLYFPITKGENIYNFPDSIHIINNQDDFYIYYDLERKPDGHCKKIIGIIPQKIKKRIYALAAFYSIITTKHFFVKENQYLKAMLFKMLFNSKNTDDSNCDETNKTIDKANSLFEKSLKKSNNSTIDLYPIDEDAQSLDPYIICNAFISAYNKLEPEDKRKINEIYNENHRTKIPN